MPKLARLMELFMKEQADEKDFMVFPEISKRISHYKNPEKGGTKMCDIVEEYAEKRAKEGVAKATANTIKNLIEFGMSVSDIAKALKTPLEEVEQIADELNEQ